MDTNTFTLLKRSPYIFQTPTTNTRSRNLGLCSTPTFCKPLIPDLS